MFKFLSGLALGIFLSVHFFDQVSFIYQGVVVMLANLLQKVQ